MQTDAKLYVGSAVVESCSDEQYYSQDKNGNNENTGTFQVKTRWFYDARIPFDYLINAIDIYNLGDVPKV